MTDGMEPLAYQNRFVRQLVQDLDNFEASTATPQIVSGPDNLILLQVSYDEWIKLVSSVFTGADICYPSESDSVRWILLRAVEQPMDLCALIANCIATNPATRAAIRDFVLNDPEINQHISDVATHITEGLINSKVIEGDCDNSVVAGKVIAIVERMNDINVDFLEIVEVGTNDEERVANVIEAIPGLGETPANEIIDFLQDILEDFAENYNAAVTDDWKNDVEEDLYCLAKESEDCSLTYRQLFDYFQARAGSELTIESVVSNVIQFVLNGDFPTDNLVASGLYAIQLAFILAGQEFAGMSVPKIGSLTRDATPSSRWEEWDECGAPSGWITIDFANGQQGFEPYGTFAAWDLNGWINGATTLQIAIRGHITGTITDLEIYFTESPMTTPLTYVGNYNVTGLSSSGVTTSPVPFSGLSITDGLFVNPAWSDSSTTRKLTKIRYKRA